MDGTLQERIPEITKGERQNHVHDFRVLNPARAVDPDLWVIAADRMHRRKRRVLQRDG